jgi:hypothetical protein
MSPLRPFVTSTTYVPLRGPILHLSPSRSSVPSISPCLLYGSRPHLWPFVNSMALCPLFTVGNEQWNYVMPMNLNICTVQICTVSTVCVYIRIRTCICTVCIYCIYINMSHFFDFQNVCTRCVPTQTELDSYIHSTSYNKQDVEVENNFGYMMRRKSEDRFLLSSNC